MREFEINLESLEPDVTLIKIAGWLDAHTFEYMEQTIGGLINDGKVKLAIDLTEVEYVSSAGAGVFIGTLSASQDKKGGIVLINPTDAVQEVFDMLGLSKVFRFAKDATEAASMLGRGQG